MHDAEHVEITLKNHGDSVVLAPVGEIDLSCAVSLRQQIQQVQKDGPQRLIIDLEQVPYMDSSGVATLVEALQSARRENCELILCNLQERVRSVFEIAKLDMVFTIAENADKALSA